MLYDACSISKGCDEVDCGDDEGDELEFILLPCHSPPAVELKLSSDGKMYLDHTFTKTESVTLAQHGVTRRIMTTLSQLDNAIALQVFTV